MEAEDEDDERIGCRERGAGTESGRSVGKWGTDSENGREEQPRHFCINIINRWC